MANYATRAQLKARLGNLGTDQDSLLDEILTQATKDIDRLCGQQFDKITATKLWDGTGRASLMLPWAWPVSAVTALQVRTGGEGTALVTVPGSDYFLEPAGREQNMPARWMELASRPTSGVNVFTSGKGTVSLQADYGFAAIPDEITQVCLEISASDWRQRGSGAGSGVSAAELGLDDVVKSMSPRSLAILKKHGYKRALIACWSSSKSKAPRGIRSDVKGSGNDLTGRIQTRSKAARFSQRGRRPGGQPPTRRILRWLRLVRGSAATPATAFLVARAIARRGTQGHPIMEAVLAAKKAQVIEAFKAALREAVKRA